jgi:hypothetical protein
MDQIQKVISDLLVVFNRGDAVITIPVHQGIIEIVPEPGNMIKAWSEKISPCIPLVIRAML